MLGKGQNRIGVVTMRGSISSVSTGALLICLLHISLHSHQYSIDSRRYIVWTSQLSLPLIIWRTRKGSSATYSHSAQITTY